MTQSFHGSAFAYQGSGCLLLGPSGSGKSRIVSEALMMGAKLIADDQVVFSSMMNLLSVGSVPNLHGVVELRGFGLIKVSDAIPKHVLHLVVELGAEPDSRIAEPEKREIEGVLIPYIKVPPAPKTNGAMLLLYLKALQEGRTLPPDWRPAA